MKYFLDTEFIEDGKTIDLISIGIVAEDGRTYYAEASECDYSKASSWVVQNVIPHLTGTHTFRRDIAEGVKHFLGEKPEIWGYYADYNWVAFCQLFGTMMDLPRGYPMYCRDIKQLCDSMGNPRLPVQRSVKHNALADAQWTKEAYDLLTECRGPLTI